MIFLNNNFLTLEWLTEKYAHRKSKAIYQIYKGKNERNWFISTKERMKKIACALCSKYIWVLGQMTLS